MPYGALFFLIGSGIAITRCTARPQEVAAAERCAHRYNLTEDEAGLMMFVAVSADEYEVGADESQKCLVDCVAHEAGYLNADDEFTVSEFVKKEKALSFGEDKEKKQEDKREDHKVLFECVETVENWDGWDRKAKCQKGYLFFKCKGYGVDGFKQYMELQHKLATGELKRPGSPTRFDSSSDEDESESAGTAGERNMNGTEQTSSTGHAKPGVIEGLPNRVSGLSLNEAIPPSSQLNTPNNM